MKHDWTSSGKISQYSMTIKKSYVSKLKIWTKRSNFLRPAFYDDDDDDHYTTTSAATEIMFMKKTQGVESRGVLAIIF